MPEKISTAAAVYFDFPEEVISNLPVSTVVGNKRIIVQNFKGIKSYGENVTEIKIKGGLIEVTGEKLIIAQINGDYIDITGKIAEVRYCMGEKNE
jgi:sporulation protein YqfC